MSYKTLIYIQISQVEDDTGPELWPEEFADLELDSSINSENSSYSPLVQLYTFFLFMFQTLFRLSDTALNILMKFLVMFFTTLSKQFNAIPQSFISILPGSLHSARQVQNSRNKFRKYVCCPSCRSIYEWDQCSVTLANGNVESKCCDFIRFPNHPQSQHRQPCGAVLMKKVKYFSGKVAFYPKLIYCYKSIIESLQEMLARPDFSAKCDDWRSRPVAVGVYRDVYDGSIWEKFQAPDGVPFLNLPNNFAFQINVDWFNPFKHTQHSEGAIYMTVMNLPRQERFLQENVILVGVIPGPKEPPLHINTFLRPLVDELKDLWKGICLKNSEGSTVIVRGALICSGCDIPAARKVCGFVGHRATKGCSKCLKSFITESFGEKADYSDFNRTSWVHRTNDCHRVSAQEYRKCNTQTDQRKIERETGIRYTLLLELPYFDAVQMCTIDPMHNMLLGTAKHVIETWKSLSIINSKNYDIIQEKVNSFVCPADIGRLPSKISSGFSGFTAEQWKNWIIFFSLFALKDVISWQHYNCWHLFVKACFFLCRRTISSAQLKSGDEFLMDFCKKFTKLYGSEHCTINMHLHGHLAECIRDYGPVYSFWCFAFERMNGILGSYHTNNHHVSIQFARRFLDSKLYAPINWPIEYVGEYLPLLNCFDYQKGSLMQATVETEITGCSGVSLIPLPPVCERALHQNELNELHPIFDGVLEKDSYKVLVLCRQATALHIKNYVIGAQNSRHSQSSFVLARHTSDDNVGLAQIEYFAECVAISNSSNQPTRYWVAAVLWFMEHPCRVWFGSPVEVWCTASYPGTSFIPITNILSRVVYTKCTYSFGRLIGNDSVHIVIPLVSNV